MEPVNSTLFAAFVNEHFHIFDHTAPLFDQLPSVCIWWNLLQSLFGYASVAYIQICNIFSNWPFAFSNAKHRVT